MIERFLDKERERRIGKIQRDHVISRGQDLAGRNGGRLVGGERGKRERGERGWKEARDAERKKGGKRRRWMLENACAP